MEINVRYIKGLFSIRPQNNKLQSISNDEIKNNKIYLIEENEILNDNREIEQSSKKVNLNKMIIKNKTETINNPFNIKCNYYYYYLKLIK